MTPIPFHTRWVRRESFSTNYFSVNKTYRVEEWLSEEKIKVQSNLGTFEVTDPLFWEIDEYMENLERHILN